MYKYGQKKESAAVKKDSAARTELRHPTHAQHGIPTVPYAPYTKYIFEGYIHAHIEPRDINRCSIRCLNPVQRVPYPTRTLVYPLDRRLLRPDRLCPPPLLPSARSIPDCRQTLTTGASPARIQTRSSDGNAFRLPVLKNVNSPHPTSVASASRAAQTCLLLALTITIRASHVNYPPPHASNAQVHRRTDSFTHVRTVLWGSGTL